MIRSLAAIVLSVLTLGTMVSLAEARPIGSPALAIRDTNLLAHPRGDFPVTGSMDKGERVLVERCQRLWCQVIAGGDEGWVFIDALSFGTKAKPRWTGPRLNFPAGGDGKVCLYEGPNYTGAKLCGETGFVLRDLATVGLDNHFASIKIDDGVSAIVCRARNNGSYCARITKSQPELNGFLNHAVSSFRVY